MNSKAIAAAAFLGAAPLIGAIPAVAGPAASFHPGETSMLQDVVWPCGPGWRPNGWGECVPARRGWDNDDWRWRRRDEPHWRWRHRDWDDD